MSSGNNNGQEMRLLTLNSNVELAEEISKSMGVPLSPCSVNQFSDGETQINIEESVRGCAVYVIQSTSEPVNENVMELLILIDALKRASAKTIIVVMPYYGYARQDRKARSREPITSKLIANLLQNSGADRVVTLDLHAEQIQGFLYIPLDHLRAFLIFSDYILEKEIENTIIVSPDHGGVVRDRRVADRLKAPIGIIDKRRPKPNVAEVMNIIGEVEGKTAVIVDDIIDTAGTMTLAADALIEKGAKAVYACVTHPVLSGPAIERIEKSQIKEMVVTNSICLPEEKKIDKLTQLSVASLFADAIKRVHNNESVSTLFD